jgi:hypothetical protein
MVNLPFFNDVANSATHGKDQTISSPAIERCPIEKRQPNGLYKWMDAGETNGQDLHGT